MPHLTYSRTEWATISETIAKSDPDTVPVGLAQRVAALLDATPASWSHEPCVLELEATSAAYVERVVATRQGLAGAERIIHAHQQGNPTASHRIELRAGGISSVVAYLTDTTNLHRQLERHAARLLGTATAGTLVLIEQASLKELAAAPLLPEEDAGPGS